MNIAKNINVIFSMLTMEVKNSEYIMKRRALILFFVQEKGIHNIEELVIKINTENISTSESEIQDDISSLFRCGIDITVAEDGTIKLNNIIDGLMIPQRVILEYETIIEKLKKFLRPKLQHIDHDLLKIIDFSYAGSENSSWFENYTYKVFCTFCSNTKWLGGSSRPDVIAEFGNVGLIIDSKAYKDGFSASRSLKDEMIRYVNEADNKPQDVPIKWWEEFSPNVTRFAFQYVSTKFCSEIENQLKDISAHSYSHEKGAAISAANLLLLAEQANNGNIDSRCFESNKEITLGA